MLTEPQRALISTISEGQKAIQQAEVILETKLEVPDLGTDPVSGLMIPSLHPPTPTIILLFSILRTGFAQVEADPAGHEQAERVISDCGHERGYGHGDHTHLR